MRRLCPSGKLVACLLVLLLSVSGCTTIDTKSNTQFGQGVAAVSSDSQALFLDVNSFARELQLDRAVGLESIKESDFTAALDAESVDRWNSALESLALYSSGLQLLSDSAGAAEVNKSIQALGDRIIALNSPATPGAGGADEASKALGHIGQLIVEAAAKKKALEIARDADPSVRATLLFMADMIGADHGSGGVRTTLWSNWTARIAQIRVEFVSAGGGKRQVAAKCAVAIEQRNISDLKLSALRKSLLELADLHTAIAQGRSADAAEMIAVLKREIDFAKSLAESAKPTKKEDGK